MKFVLPFFSIVILLLSTSSDNPSSRQVYMFNYENVLGTSFTLRVEAQTPGNAREAEKAALNEIDRLADILNTYDKNSEFSRWQKTLNTDESVSPELIGILSQFEKWQAETNGALNASIGVATALWEKADETNTLPGTRELSSAVTEMNKKHWILDEENMTARHLTNDPLVLNTFVKSYIISKASSEVMNVNGVTSSILSIGGDMVVAGESEEKISVSDPVGFADNRKPLATISVAGKAIATSGNYHRGYMVGDEWFSHILDARTASPVQNVISATVVAGDATEAGALATAFNILTPEESISLAEKMTDAEFLIVTKEGKTIESDGWKKLVLADEETHAISFPVSGKSSAEAAADYELSIEFEITRFQGRSPRPYIAVWLENEKAEPVRTLALWFNNYRWLPDLRRWYTKHYEKAQQYDFMQMVTSATRSAGKYTLAWDGADDSGKAVKPGTYTIYIEASREHGTYQLLKKEIDLNKKNQRIELEGGVEISSAVLDYHKAEKNKTVL